MEITKTNDKGSLIISQEALSSIAINAAKDVDGVGSFSNRPVDVSIYINILPNKKIKSVSENVQTSVHEAIENMTGKSVGKVNVIIAGIDLPESGDSNEPKTSEE